MKCVSLLLSEHSTSAHYLHVEKQLILLVCKHFFFFLLIVHVKGRREVVNIFLLIDANLLSSLPFGNTRYHAWDPEEAICKVELRVSPSTVQPACQWQVPSEVPM